jgi:hypothetical protein
VLEITAARRRARPISLSGRRRTLDGYEPGTEEEARR